MVKALPTLSSEGWVTQLTRKVDRALAYALLTDGLQSTLYRNNLTSMQDIVQSTLHDEVELAQKMKSHLERYLERLFDGAQVTVRVEPHPDPLSEKLLIRIEAAVQEDGQTHQLVDVIPFVRGIFDRVNHINTYGVDPNS